MHKIREGIVSSSEVKCFVLTVPFKIAERFEGVSFSCYSMSSSIVFESGAKTNFGVGSPVGKQS